MPTRTTLGGAFDRATGAEPFDLPPALPRQPPAGSTATATYDFVTADDIIGGNSGSPVIDREGKVIGAAFDGNIHGLGGDYGYDGTMTASIAVSTAAVEQALRNIYPAPHCSPNCAAARRSPWPWPRLAERGLGGRAGHPSPDTCARPRPYSRA